MTRACRRAALLAMLWSCVVPADTITRHVPEDYATIQAAMTAAVSGDSVLVSSTGFHDGRAGMHNWPTESAPSFGPRCPVSPRPHRNRDRAHRPARRRDCRAEGRANRRKA